MTANDTAGTLSATRPALAAASTVNGAATRPEPSCAVGSAARAARCADAALLAQLLVASRAATLATFAQVERALSDAPRVPGTNPAALEVPYVTELNPPRWELGHIGWFQTWWIGRFTERARGIGADPKGPRLDSHQSDADPHFDSARVPHRERWQLPLPSSDELRVELARGLDETLARLREAGADDAALYFYRLCLFHEDMHHEAALTMAQRLGIPLVGPAPVAHAAAAEIAIAGALHLAGGPDAGFAFDNELGRHAIELRAYRIDAAPVTWARFIRFVEATDRAPPRTLRAIGSRWERLAFGRWVDLDPTLPAMHLACGEAEAYCAWAGRRLPSEFEWEHAAEHASEHAAERAAGRFAWGQVWEWTASRFMPYPGFVAHPYRDYSAPWFGSRRVLRGGSFATAARMKHPRYRNFFAPDRDDIVAGFRTCALF